MLQVRRLALLSLLFLGLMMPAVAAPTVKINNIKESKPKIYTIAVDVPQFVSPSPPQKAVNAAIWKSADATLKEFRKQAAEAHPTDPQVWDLTIKAQTKYLSDRWFSYQESGGEYTGGAHPQPILLSYNYDLRRGRELALKDLFRPGAAYLQTLSDICRKRLPNVEELNSDKDWRAKGSAPTADNYSVFHLDGKNLVVVFPPYQIAPYSSGSLEVKIPYNQLQSIANPAGPLVTR